MALRFWKYHGLGNDFVVVEGTALMAPGRAVALCDRRRGIGADGVLTILPARDGGAAYMHIYNPDGSVAAMCGNGIRCVARHLAETRGLDGEFVIETDSGPRTCTVHRGPEGVDSITVDMGRARVEGTQDFVVGVGAGPHAARLHGQPARRDPRRRRPGPRRHPRARHRGAGSGRRERGLRAAPAAPGSTSWSGSGGPASPRPAARAPAPRRWRRCTRGGCRGTARDRAAARRRARDLGRRRSRRCG